MVKKMDLGNFDMLQALASPQYADLLGAFRERMFAKKATICRPDDDSNQVFLVKRGRVRVFLAYEDKEFTLAILEQGDLFSTHTRAFAQAMEETVLLVSGVEKLQRHIFELPAFGLNMVKVLGELLKNSISVINGLVFKDARLRLADFLLQQAEEKGEDEAGGIRIELGLNVEEIALLIGASRQTVSTLLSDLQKAGIVEKCGRKSLLITDLPRLRQATQPHGSPL